MIIFFPLSSNDAGDPLHEVGRLLVCAFESRFQLVSIDDPDELLRSFSVRVHERYGGLPDVVLLGRLQTLLDVDLSELDIGEFVLDPLVFLLLRCARPTPLQGVENYFGYILPYGIVC